VQQIFESSTQACEAGCILLRTLRFLLPALRSRLKEHWWELKALPGRPPAVGEPRASACPLSTQPTAEPSITKAEIQALIRENSMNVK